MAPLPTPTNLGALPLGSASESVPSGGMLVRPFGEITVPRPEQSGLFPAVEVQPTPMRHVDRRLRRAVLLTVVVGVIGLLAYASWQRAAHARTAEPVHHVAR